jgi:bifunctional non-homologous end joining protein LigD
VADVMIPHLKDRPSTFKRYPNGVDGMSFYEKHSPSGAPEWLRTVSVPSKSGHDPIEYTLVADRPTLIWAANLAAIEFHVPLWRVTKGKQIPAPPDQMVFDLDPGPGTTIADCCEVAQWLVKRLGDVEVFAKTSGSKGLQLYTRVTRTTWDKSTERAHELARAVEADHPDRVVSIMRKELRKGKVLIDWSQNNSSKTTVAVYSLRARDEPTASTPLEWREVVKCAKSGDPDSLRFDANAVIKRVTKLGDLMAPLAGSRAIRKTSK